MALYNLSFMDNATNPLDLIQGIGSVVANQFLIGNLILATFFTLFLVLSYRNNFIEVLLIDCFICIILAMLLFTAGLIQIYIVSVPVVIFVLALIYYLMS